MEYSVAGGKLIHEKNQKQKISWHCPFKSAEGLSFYTLLYSLFVSGSPGYMYL